MPCFCATMGVGRKGEWMSWRRMNSAILQLESLDREQCSQRLVTRLKPIATMSSALEGFLLRSPCSRSHLGLTLGACSEGGSTHNLDFKARVGVTLSSPMCNNKILRRQGLILFYISRRRDGVRSLVSPISQLPYHWDGGQPLFRLPHMKEDRGGLLNYDSRHDDIG